MRFFRSQRVETVIQVELSKILLREVEFPDAFVTITSVDVDKKMERAKIFVSVLPASAEKAAMKTLQYRAGELQHMLVRKLNIKPMPFIIFELDHGPENAAKIEKLAIDQKIDVGEESEENSL